MTRPEALTAGIVTFSTGWPCNRGHVVERYTSNGGCVACHTLLRNIREEGMSVEKRASLNTEYAKRKRDRAKVGIYRILNTVNGKCYVGQSRNLEKRIAEHKRLLRIKRHPNQKLQHAFTKYGEQAFVFTIEIECDDTADLDYIEMMFISGEAVFDDNVAEYNICREATSGMAGRIHSEETRRKIAANRRPVANVSEWKRNLVLGAIRSAMTDPDRRWKIDILLAGEGRRNCDLAKAVGMDASTCLKTTKRFRALRDQGKLNEYLF